MKSSITGSIRPSFATSDGTRRKSEAVCATSLLDGLDACERLKPAVHLRDESYALIGAFPVVAGRAHVWVGVTAYLLAMEAAGMMGSRVFAPSWRWVASLCVSSARLES